MALPGCLLLAQAVDQLGGLGVVYFVIIHIGCCLKFNP